MTRPVVTASTERIYAELPEVMRDADEHDASDNGYPLLRYLSLIGDQLDELTTLLERFSYDEADPADSSDLADPALADAAWLPWLGQLLGVRPSAARSAEGLRPLLIGAAGGWNAGTPASIAAAAQTVLTGSKSVAIYPFYGGDPWTIEIRVRPAEVTSAADVINAVLAANVKPAGATLVVTIADATWNQVEAAWVTWNDIEGGGLHPGIDWQTYERGTP